MVSGRDISDMLPGPSMQLQNGQLDPGEEYSAKNSAKTLSHLKGFYNYTFSCTTGK